MNPRSDMRASDADREAVAEQLRSALNEGRLDLREYDERLQRAYVAKTYGELDGLLTDLPGTVPPQRSRVAPAATATPSSDAGGPAAPPGPSGSAGPSAPETHGAFSGRSAVLRGWLLATWSSYLSVVGITSAVWLVTCLGSGKLHYFWPIWVAGPWGAVLLVSTITGLLGGAPYRRWHGHPASWNSARQARYAARGAAREARYAARDARRRARRGW